MSDDTPKAAPLIYVEDNDSDQLIVRKLCEKSMGFVPECFDNGMDFFDYLGQYTERSQLPRLILLDLNMPAMNGFEVIEVLKNHDLYRCIPVVVLSSSGREKDIQTCYRHHVNGYLKKYLDFEDYSKALKDTLDFWLNATQTLSD